MSTTTYPTGLDAGIEDLVYKLIDAGFDTRYSGDGRVGSPMQEMEKERKGVLLYPHIAAHTTRDALLSEADRMQSLLPRKWFVEATYSTRDGVCLLLAKWGG